MGEADTAGDGRALGVGESEPFALGVGEPVADGDAEGVGDGVTPLGAADGPGVGWTGPGAKATIAPTTIAAVITPASSPRTMATRGGMAGGYQYQAPEAASMTTG